MNTPQMIVYIGGTMLVSAFLGLIIAKFKNRSPDGWGFACFIFPPLLLVLLLLPQGNYHLRRKKISQNDLDEDIKDEWF